MNVSAINRSDKRHGAGNACMGWLGWRLADVAMGTRQRGTGWAIVPGVIEAMRPCIPYRYQ